jgi:hypothetical protein
MKQIIFLSMIFISQASFAGWGGRNVLWCAMETTPPCNTSEATITFPQDQEIPDLAQYSLKQELTFQIGDLLIVDQTASWGESGYGSQRLVRDEDAQGPFWGVIQENDGKPMDFYTALIRRSPAGEYQLSKLGCYEQNKPVFIKSQNCVATNEFFMKLPSFVNHTLRVLREKTGH